MHWVVISIEQTDQNSQMSEVKGGGVLAGAHKAQVEKEGQKLISTLSHLVSAAHLPRPGLGQRRLPSAPPSSHS